MVALIGKYFNGGYGGMVQLFPFGEDGIVRAYSGSDLAGCLRTRKSTYGGVWASTQKAVKRRV